MMVAASARDEDECVQASTYTYALHVLCPRFILQQSRAFVHTCQLTAMINSSTNAVQVCLYVHTCNTSY